MNMPSLFRNDNSLWSMDPFRQMSQFQKRMDRLFGNLDTDGSLPTTFSAQTYSPACEVEEMENHFVLSMDAPGMKKDDIKVELRGSQLSIAGERKEEKEENKNGRFRSERFYGSFQRTFSLPEEVKAEQIETEYKDGVLRIAIPKAVATHTKQIKVGESKPGFFEKLLKGGPKSDNVKDSNKVA